MKKCNSLKEATINSLLAWFPFLVCVISVPLAVFIPNQPAFEYDVSTISPFLFIGVSVWIGLFLVYYFRGKTKSRSAVILFFIGLFILLSQMFAPMNWDILDGEAKLSEPLSLSLVELMLIIAVLAVAWFVKGEIIRSVAPVIVAAFAFSQAFYLISGIEISKANSLPNNGEIVETKPSGLPNIYHFVFDAYSSLTFQETIERLNVKKDFDSFVFFKNNLSNYIITAGSVPSYLTGSLYQEGAFVDWQALSRKAGMRKTLKDNGYRVSLYVPDKSNNWFFEEADQIVTSREFALSFFSGSEKFRLAQIAMVRTAPNFLRKETLKVSEKLLGKIVGIINGVEDLKGLSGYRFYKRLSVPVLEQFIIDEEKRPASGQYIYVHVILPHPPMTWSANCQYASSSSFKEQTDCATSSMVKVTEKLKKLKKLTNSLVIFQSDHGYHSLPPHTVEPIFIMPENVVARITETNKFFPKKGIAKRVHSLLLVKLPGAKQQPLEVSNSSTQLLDIPETVFDAVGLKNMKATQGQSVFSLEASNPRKIHVFSGIYTRNENGKTRILGRRVNKVNLGHVSFQLGKGWKVENDLPAIGR